MSKSRANKMNRYKNQLKKQKNDVYKTMNSTKGKKR